jgi:chromosome segregation ATPase
LRARLAEVERERDAYKAQAQLMVAVRTVTKEDLSDPFAQLAAARAERDAYRAETSDLRERCAAHERVRDRARAERDGLIAEHKWLNDLKNERTAERDAYRAEVERERDEGRRRLDMANWLVVRLREDRNAYRAEAMAWRTAKDAYEDMVGCEVGQYGATSKRFHDLLYGAVPLRRANEAKEAGDAPTE